MKLAISALLLIFLVYLFAFPTPLRPEIALWPAWAVDAATGPVKTAGDLIDAPAYPFDLGGVFGYVSDDGRILLRENKLFGVAIDKDRFINYSSVSGNLVIHDNSGRVISNLELSGYPVFLDGRLFVLSTNRAGLAEIVSDERVYWKREYTSVITDLDVQNGLVAVGLLDARVQILDDTGAVNLELDMKGSRINAVYGCALSDDATRVAVIHGIDPQNLSFLALSGEAPEIATYRLETEYRTARYLGFYGNDAYLLIEQKDAMLILDLSDDTEYTIGSVAPFVDAGGFGNGNLIWVIFGEEETAELILLDPPQKILFRIPLSGVPNASSKDDAIMLGSESRLYLLNKEVR